VIPIFRVFMGLLLSRGAPRQPFSRNQRAGSPRPGIRIAVVRRCLSRPSQERRLGGSTRRVCSQGFRGRARGSDRQAPAVAGCIWVYREHRCRGSLTTSTLRCSPLSKMGSESQLQPISVLVTSVKVTPDLSSETHTWFRVFPIGGARGETPPDGERPAAKLAEHHAQN